MAHSTPYISRQPAEDLQNSFVSALANPALYPVMFYIWGIGGVGKTTLKERLKETYRQQADFTEVSFGLTERINTPIELMVKLHERLPPLGFWQVDIPAKDDPFQMLYKEYQQIANQLQTQPIEGKNSVEKEQLDLVESLLKQGAGAIAAISGLNKPMLETTFEIALKGKDLLRKVLQQHRATKKNTELQDLMLHPIPKLTKAFVEALVLRSQKTGKTVVLVLDTYEKVLPALDCWLWQSLLENTKLQQHRIRLVMAGRKSLLDEEMWHKLHQDSNLIFELKLNRFDQSQTQRYLNNIGIEDAAEITKIFNFTKGLPYYLNLYRQHQKNGKQFSFAEGTQSIVKLFLQGLNDREKQALQIAACCRWFDRRLIQHLLAQQSELNWENGQNCYDWLIDRKDFVESLQSCYRLDDVARDVFREDLFKESRDKFYKIHQNIAQYFSEEAEKAVSTSEHITEKYNSLEWRNHKKEYLYHISFLNERDYQKIFLTYLFESHYFQQLDIVQQPVKNISSEANLGLDKYDLLSEKVRRFLSDIKPVIDYGLEIIEEEKSNCYFIAMDAFINNFHLLCQHLNKVDDENLNKLFDKSDEEKSIRDLITNFSTQIHTFRDSFYDFLLGQIEPAKKMIFRNDSLEGLAKFVLLIYKARCISETKDLSLNGAKQCAISLNNNNDYKEFTANIFLMLGKTYFILDMYEDACDSYRHAIETNHSYEALCSMALCLDIQGKYEEAHDFHSRALTRNRDERAKIVLFFNDIKNLLDLFHGNKKEAFSNYLENRLIQYLPNIKEAEYATGIASILSLLGWHDEAISFLNKCLLNNSESYEIWYRKGHIFLQLARYEEAVLSFNKAIFIKSDYYSAWNEQGFALRQLGRYEEAILSHNKALEINPDDNNALSHRGYAFLRLGRLDEAFADFERQMEFSKGSSYYDKACFYAVQNQIDEAIPNLQKAIEIDSEEYSSRAKTDFDFDNIRHDPRFQALIQ
ncbi:tetratricopeptide repeat protein [Pseudanabaena sp. 'Roaring Creek']|uniref:tetratricopeptide repeat protein n=1 Tax=Pseudanabaena sp. 'Roaring Creek' TaxID=1681830 RepID=UPI0006D7B3B6|nr:tetratricopeptide repeat protein [Pseudanabaena sp. 'Roaring Creek']